MIFYGLNAINSHRIVCRYRAAIIFVDHIQIEMSFSLRLLQLMLLASTTEVFTIAMICNKMVWDGRSGGSNGVDDIMEMGRYSVMTTKRTDSPKVQYLISVLDGLSNIQYEDNSFTAILLPKVLKKVFREILKFQNKTSMADHSCSSY